jgi:hypothetical protein
LREYIERHLGAEALRPTWRARRQRLHTGIHAQQAAAERGSDDRDGTALARRLGTFGEALQRAGRRFAGALADLDRASGRLERGSRVFTAGAAAIDPWLEKRWWEHYYGQDQARDR